MFRSRACRTITFFLALTVVGSLSAQQANDQPVPQTPWEAAGKTKTPEYEQGLQFYRELADRFDEVQIREFGPTDSGRPLHLVMLSVDHDFNLESIRGKGRSILLINNAIHPGESDGVDASMLMLRDLLYGRQSRVPLNSVFVAIIPYYNIGGALNRNQHSRANQNGPEEYGFRGNARNYDLNRDFIKCDTRNAREFARIFHLLDPDLFIDTHVSNGADYQYVMTTAHSQKDKLGGQLGAYLHETLEPMLFRRMEQSGYPTTPYVNAFAQTPDQGFSQFLETPRYSTGYTALFQTIGFMTETHMLKPYPQRVDATRVFLQHALEVLAEEGTTIRNLRHEDRAKYAQQETAAVAWQLDRNQPSRVRFLGYEAREEKSSVTVGNRLLYDRSKPFERDVLFFNNYVPTTEVELPAGYVIPAGWHKVIELMRLNQVKMRPAAEEMKLRGEFYQIENVTTDTRPYEGHYMHRQVSASKQGTVISVKPGDMLISLDQPAARYIVETLEPQAVDSLFRWNYFDTILQRKEHYSSYVFEELAADLLQKDSDLRSAFEAKLAEDSDFADSRRMQLDFIYQNSPHNEEAYQRYPVSRVLSFESLPMAAQPD